MLSFQYRRVKSPVFLLVLFAASVLPGALGKDYGNHNKIFTPATKITAADLNNPQELERVWHASLVRIPAERGHFISAQVHEVFEKQIPGKQYPTVIYMHGCAGVWSGTHKRLNLLAKQGFAVIAPQSFARTKYPQSCNPRTYKAGMNRVSLKIRHIDAEHAIARAKGLPWVDADNMFLMGLSEGAITTATFVPSSPSTSVKARVVEGWTCHAGWQEYKGLSATKKEPVLALLGKNDPWFQEAWMRGHCGTYMNKYNGSKSIVFDQPPLNTRHELLEDPGVQQTVFKFLNKQIQ